MGIRSFAAELLLPAVLQAKSRHTAPAAAPGAPEAVSFAVLAEKLGPLLFAGEATHRGLAGTIGGAWAEGERAAKSVLGNLPAA